MKQRGITLVETMVAVALGALVLLIAVPALQLMRQGRVQGTVREFIGDVRNARARAASTGWEYRIVGFRAGLTGTTANKYRVLARKSSSVTWPSDTTAPLKSATQFASNWVDVAKNYPGVRLSPGGSTGVARFELTFAPRGIVTASSGSFAPFTVLGQNGATKTFTISSLGSVTLQ